MLAPALWGRQGRRTPRWLNTSTHRRVGVHPYRLVVSRRACGRMIPVSSITTRQPSSVSGIERWSTGVVLATSTLMQGVVSQSPMAVPTIVESRSDKRAQPYATHPVLRDRAPARELLQETGTADAGNPAALRRAAIASAARASPHRPSSRCSIRRVSRYGRTWTKPTSAEFAWGRRRSSPSTRTATTRSRGASPTCTRRPRSETMSSITSPW